PSRAMPRKTAARAIAGSNWSGFEHDKRGNDMLRKLAFGVAGLVVIGGGAWAATQYLGPQAQAPAGQSDADHDDEDDRLLARPGGGEIQVDDNGFPRLRNGLWNVTTDTDGVTMTARICLDDAFQNEASLFAIQLNSSFC